MACAPGDRRRVPQGMHDGLLGAVGGSLEQIVEQGVVQHRQRRHRAQRILRNGVGGRKGHGDVAAAVAEAVNAADADMILFGLSGSHSITEAKRIGLRTASEAFADRTYQNDGSLTPRTEVNALISDSATSIEQVLNMIRYGRVRTTEAVMIQITAETICIHGDATHAVDFARSIKSALAENAIAIEKP